MWLQPKCGDSEWQLFIASLNPSLGQGLHMQLSGEISARAEGRERILRVQSPCAPSPGWPRRARLSPALRTVCPGHGACGAICSSCWQLNNLQRGRSSASWELFHQQRTVSFYSFPLSLSLHTPGWLKLLDLSHLPASASRNCWAAGGDCCTSPYCLPQWMSVPGCSGMQ